MCAVMEGLAESLGCQSGASEQAYYFAIPGRRLPLEIKRCPIAWLRDGADWSFLLAVIRAKNLAGDGNLSAFFPLNEEPSAVFWDAYQMYGSEQGRIREEARKRRRK